MAHLFYKTVFTLKFASLDELEMSDIAFKFNIVDPSYFNN
jgi:hypothetical protein